MNLNCPQSQAFMIFILLTVDVCCFCYNLKNEENVESYIKDLIENLKRMQVIRLSLVSSNLQFQRLEEGRLSYFPKFSCGVHKSSILQFVCLKPWKWTNCLGKNYSRRLRLIPRPFRQHNSRSKNLFVLSKPKNTQDIWHLGRFAQHVTQEYQRIIPNTVVSTKQML